MDRFRELWGLALLVVVVPGVTAGCTSPEAINSYYANLLQRRVINDVSGPHFWKNGKIFWAGNLHLEFSSDLGATSAHEVNLPDSWQGPARFVSDTLLADQRNVYLKVGGEYQKVLGNFRCWNICGSQLKSGDFVVGEYGNRIYRVNGKTGEATLILAKPAQARHFHVTAVDPFTNDIYTSLGDALKKYEKFGDRVTGIMRSQDGGETWQWLYKTIVGAGKIDRQPTAVYFERDKIYFGTDTHPHGIFVLDRKPGNLDQVFEMSNLFASWFTKIERKKGSYWAVSRAFSPPHKGFGVLWWSGDGKTWTPIQLFRGSPVWLQFDAKDGLMSVGFVERNLNVVAFKLPARGQMSEWVRHGPTMSLLDRLLRRKPI